MTRSHLNVRNPVVYRAKNPNSENDFRQWLQTHDHENARDLKSLSNDPEFIRALRDKDFYRVTFDEPFQLSRRAIVFGYKSRRSPTHEAVFVLVRFPDDLAKTLRFESVRTGG